MLVKAMDNPQTKRILALEESCGGPLQIALIIFLVTKLGTQHVLTDLKYPAFLLHVIIVLSNDHLVNCPMLWVF